MREEFSGENPESCRKFRGEYGVSASGSPAGGTDLMLSGKRSSPKMYPQKIRRGGTYGN